MVEIDLALIFILVTGKRVQIRKRRLIKDFRIGLMEVCTDEAAPEVATNKSMLARLVGLSSNENRSSQRWRDLIQAAKKSKIIGNRDSESGRFGSIKKKQNENEAEQKETEVSQIEFKPNDTKIETEQQQKSESNLYPKIPEEDLNAVQHAPTAVTIQPTSKPKPPIPSIPSPPILEKKTLTSGIKLSPEALIKHAPLKPKEIKYPAPKPLEKPLAPPSNTEKKVMGISSILQPARPIERPPVSKPDVTPKSMYPVCTPKEKAICKDTKITVTTSPEKTIKPKAETQTTIEIIKDQPNTQLIDFKDNLNIECSVNTTAVRIDNLESNTSNLSAMAKPKEVIGDTESQTKSLPLEKVEHSEITNINQYQLDREGNVLKREPRSDSSMINDSKGWL